MNIFYKIFYSRPFFYVAILFILGILFSKFVNISIISVISILCLLCIIFIFLFIFRFFHLTYLILFLSIFFLGSFIYQSSLKNQPNHVKKIVPNKKKEVLVEGNIITDPKYSKTVYYSYKTTFILKIRKIKRELFWEEMEGKVKIFVYDHPDIFEYGDLIRIEGRFFKPNAASNPGEFNYRNYLKLKKIYALLSVRKEDKIKLVSVNRGKWILSKTFKIKEHIKNNIYHILSRKDNASLITALLLGDRKSLSSDIERNFKKSGTLHILAISGLHVGIFICIFLAFFKIIGVNSKISYLLVVGLVFWYALFTGGRPSIVRATVMASVLLIGKVINRKGDIYNSLGIACFIILFFSPLQLFTPGFILSFTAVLSIVYFTPKIEPRLNITSVVVGKTINYFVKLSCVSISVWLGLTPLLWFFFNIISPITVIANLVVVPVCFLLIVSSILMITNFYFYIPVYNLFSYIINGLSDLLFSTVKFLSALNWGHFYVPDLKLQYLLLIYLGLIGIFNFNKFNFRKRKILILGVVYILVWILTYIPFKDNGVVKVTFLDLHKENCIVIECPNKKTILINKGKYSKYNTGENVIGPFLWHQGIWAIDAILFTNLENSNLKVIKWLFDYFNVNSVYDNGFKSPSDKYFDYIDIIRKNKIQRKIIKDENSISVCKEVELKTFSGEKGIVLFLKYKRFKALFIDINMLASKRKILNIVRENNLSILNFLNYKNSEERNIEFFLKKFIPDILILSEGENEQIENFKKTNLLRKFEGEIYITGLHGAVKIISGGENFRIEKFNK